MALRALFSSEHQSLIDLNFLKDLPEYDTTKPYYISGVLPADHEISRTNLAYEKIHNVPLFNLRGEEHKLSIEKHGFQIINLPHNISSLDARGFQKQEYLEKLTEIVKEKLEASFVLCYDCRFRSSDPSKIISHQAPSGTSQRPDSPTEACHIDHTLEGAVRRIKRHMTAEEIQKYINEKWRLRIVNIWRPFDTVQDYDLLYCDFSTVQQNDLVAVDRVSSEYIGEVYLLKPRNHYDWYWLDHQKPHEASLFLSYDSSPKSGVLFCPHTSAKNLNVTSPSNPRESVELRMIVVSPS